MNLINQEDQHLAESIISEAFHIRVRQSLKAVLMKKAEEEIERIVDEELKAMKAHIKTYHDMYMGRMMVEFLIKKEGF